MKQKCFVLDGKIIHIGQWVDDLDSTGNLKNPIPKGAVETERDLVKTPHGLFDASNYGALRKNEYPSVEDQLDAIYHAGMMPADIAIKIKADKDKYPKPSV